MISLLFILGTRPEAIKQAPLILACQRDPYFKVRVCNMAQHRQLTDNVLSEFGIVPDFDLNLMVPGQSLSDLTARGLTQLAEIMTSHHFDGVVVQGDTTSAFVGALSANYHQIPVIHLESGLRSFDRKAPFPEESNRVLIDHLASVHFAATPLGVENLRKEGIVDHVFCVGNTVIDSLRYILKKKSDYFSDYLAMLSQDYALDLTLKTVLITAHRRESWGQPLENICAGLFQLAQNFPSIQWVMPVHPNSCISEVVEKQLGGVSNFKIIGPQSYSFFIALMSFSALVLTDSGGIQEEAPFLGRPVVVMRDLTERLEGIETGQSVLVGTDAALIVDAVTRLLNDHEVYSTMVREYSPYGDGSASQLMRDQLKLFFN